MAVRIFRVIVRGRFDALSDDDRRELLVSADDHDVLQARFTPEGTLVYDRSLHAFSLRFEIREADDADPAAVTARAYAAATARAAAILDQRGLGRGALTVTGSDMASIWE